MPNLLTMKEANQVVCNVEDGITIEEHTNENNQTKIGLKSDEGNKFFFFYSDLNLENANIYMGASHDLPEDFESFKYCYTPEDGFTLNPKFIVSNIKEEQINLEDYADGQPFPETPTNPARTITYQDGSKTIVSSTGEVTQVEAP
tara:strand:+ start:3968 stop:4402 length:435 start_codon:yes stop_codon:yes gene_type:complete